MRPDDERERLSVLIQHAVVISVGPPRFGEQRLGPGNVVSGLDDVIGEDPGPGRQKDGGSGSIHLAVDLPHDRLLWYQRGQGASEALVADARDSEALVAGGS